MSFAGAPISKALIIGLSATSLLAAASSRQYLFNVPLSPHLTRDHQLWRLVLHHFAFANSSELFLGVLLLFYTSISIERLFGSFKYGSFLVATTALSTVAEVVVLLVGSRFGFTTIPAGPFAIIFAIVYQSTRLVPSSFHWKVFGIEVTNRIALYILASQLVSSQPPASVLVSLIGLLSSTLYRSPLLSLSSFRLPPRLSRFLARAFSPLLSSSPLPRRPNAAGFGDGVREIQVAFPGAFAASTAAMRGLQAQGGAVRRPAATTTAAAVPPQGPGLVQQWTEGVTGAQRQPTAQQVAELSAIFPDTPREGIVAALQRSGLDVGRAAELLLAAGP